MYELFRKYGIVPIHYAEKHLAPASLHGKELLRMVKQRLKQEYKTDKLIDLRVSNYLPVNNNLNSIDLHRVYYFDDGILKCDDISISTREKLLDIAIAPASHHVESTIEELAKIFNVRFIVDKDVVYKGKKIGNLEIISYDEICSHKLDFIYVKASDEILGEIIDTIFNLDSSIRIIIDKKYNKPLLSQHPNSRVIKIQSIN